MAARGPRPRGFRPGRRGPCLYVVLALVTPAAADVPPPTSRTGWRPGSARPRRGRPAIGRAWVARYEYRGGTVYDLPPRCCDIPSELHDAAGDLLCRPDGGFRRRRPALPGLPRRAAGPGRPVGSRPRPGRPARRPVIGLVLAGPAPRKWGVGIGRSCGRRRSRRISAYPNAAPAFAARSAGGQHPLAPDAAAVHLVVQADHRRAAVLPRQAVPGGAARDQLPGEEGVDVVHDPTQSTRCASALRWRSSGPRSPSRGSGVRGSVGGATCRSSGQHSQRCCPMSHRRPAAQGWTILSVSVRTRDGPDRLDHAYRRLGHSAADHQTGGEEPCAPPPICPAVRRPWRAQSRASPWAGRTDRTAGGSRDLARPRSCVKRSRTTSSGERPSSTRCRRAL